jgi:hypothetical protein
MDRPRTQDQDAAAAHDGLAHGRVFFMEIVNDGIALYEADGSELHQAKPKTPEQALMAAREYFEEYMGNAVGFLKIYRFCMSEGTGNALLSCCIRQRRICIRVSCSP